MKNTITIQIGGKDEWKSFDAITAHYKALSKSSTSALASSSPDINCASEYTPKIETNADNATPSRKPVKYSRTIVLVNMGGMASKVAVFGGANAKWPMWNFPSAKKNWDAKA